MTTQVIQVLGSIGGYPPDLEIRPATDGEVIIRMIDSERGTFTEGCFNVAYLRTVLADAGIVVP